MPETIRLLLVSTPRSGNTWFRHLLAGLYEVTEHATHVLTDADWSALPDQFVHQIHWPATDEFLAQSARHACRVVTLSRHPLDVLISILHFSWYTPETAGWLLGAHGDEGGLRGLSPRSRAFLDYARGPRAAALLGVTASWWGRPGVLTVRYEDLVRDPEGELRRVEAELGPRRCGDVAALLDRLSFDRLRPESTINHYWQGRPGLWRELLPPVEAGEVHPAIASHLTKYGYRFDPDPGLTAAGADANWSRCVGGPLLEAVEAHAAYDKLLRVHRELTARAEHLQCELDRCRAAVGESDGEVAGRAATARTSPPAA